MQDMMNFWPGPVDICQGGNITQYYSQDKISLMNYESVLFWDSEKLSGLRPSNLDINFGGVAKVVAPACKWGVVAGSQSSVLTTTLFVMDRVSEGHLATLIVRDMVCSSNLLSETRREGEPCVWSRVKSSDHFIERQVKQTFIHRRWTWMTPPKLLRW